MGISFQIEWPGGTKPGGFIEHVLDLFTFEAGTFWGMAGNLDPGQLDTDAIRLSASVYGGYITGLSLIHI